MDEAEIARFVNPCGDGLLQARLGFVRQPRWKAEAPWFALNRQSRPPRLSGVPRTALPFDKQGDSDRVRAAPSRREYRRPVGYPLVSPHFLPKNEWLRLRWMVRRALNG